MLEVRAIEVSRGAVPVLRGLTLQALPGQITCVVGRNGAGKTTTMKAIMGLLSLSAGEVLWQGRRLSGLPAWRVPGAGVGYVPQGRRLFGELSVAENLEIGLYAGRGGRAARDAALARFSRLGERLAQRADTLSGGEQTMLAIARALCLAPDLLLLDEPTEGLQPSMIAEVRAVIMALRAEGKAIVLVEQRIDAVAQVADSVVFVDNGHVVDTADAARLAAEPGLLAARLGV